MPWSDKAVSPVVYTPGAGEMTLDSGLSVVGGKIANETLNNSGNPNFFDDFNTLNSGIWNSANASASGGFCTFPAAATNGYALHYIATKNLFSHPQTVFVRFKITDPSVIYFRLFALEQTAGYSTYFAIHSLKYGLVVGDTFVQSFGNDIPLNEIQTVKIVWESRNVIKTFVLYSGVWFPIATVDINKTNSESNYIAIGGYYNTEARLAVSIDSILIGVGAGDLSATLLSANAFQPTAPAKLATMPSAVLTLDTTGAAGTVALYLQHYNDEVGRWESYEGVANDDTDASFTLIGSYSDVTNNISLPTLPARAGEMVRCRLKFTSTDGTAPAPSFVSLSLSWTSDVTAPDAPTINLISSVLPEGGAPGYRVDFGSLPAGSRHLIVEGKINGSDYAPFSNRAKFEADNSYMLFRGDVAQIEAAGERNESHLSFMKGLSEGDVVQVRCAAEDDVGNRSAFTESDAVTLSASSSVPQLYIEDAVVFSGSTANIRVHLVGVASDPVTVDLATADGTAAAPGDYTALSTSLTFEADEEDGHRWQDIEINANGDNPQSGTLAYSVVLSNATGATIERGTGTVTLKALDYVPVPVEGWAAVWDDTSTWEGVWE